MKRLQLIVFVMLWGISFGSYAADLKRLFLTPEQRLSIDSERQVFLKAKNTNSLSKERKQEKTEVAEHQTSASQQNSLQKPLSVTAIIITPDGTQYIRVNDDYRKGLVARQTDKTIEKRSFETHFNVNETQVVIPVGNTYLPDSRKLIKNYQYNLRNKVEESAHETSK